MKIEIDVNKKELLLKNNKDKVISKYSYKNCLNEYYTVENLKSDIDDFNITLSKQPEFNNITELKDIINLHDWK